MTEAHLFAIGITLAALAGVRAYLPVFGIGSDVSRKEWMQLARQLLSLGYLVQGEYNVLKLTSKCMGILFNDEKIFLKKAPRVEKAPRSARRSHTPVAGSWRSHSRRCGCRGVASIQARAACSSCWP